MSSIENPDVSAELAYLLPEELAKVKTLYKTFREDGVEEGRATRDAIAAVLEEQRMKKPGPTERQYRDMFFWHNEFKKTMPDEEAERKAWDKIMLNRAPGKR